MSEATYVPCPHCGHAYPMSAMQKELYRGRTLSCNHCAKPFSADDLTPVPVPPAPLQSPAAPRPKPVQSAAPSPSGRKISGRAVVAMSVGGAALLILLLVVILLPPLNRAREQANRVKCASNLRQVGQAVFIYASVNGGRFPDRLDKLLSYAGSSVFVCPSGNDSPAPGATPQLQASNLYTGGHLSYVYVGAGLSTNAGFGNAPTTVVMYEPLANHRDGINVLYADGSVQFLARPAAIAMIATLPPAATQPATGPSTQPATMPSAATAPAPSRPAREDEAAAPAVARPASLAASRFKSAVGSPIRRKT